MKSGKPKLTSRDQAILNHLGRYRLTFKEVVRHLYFNGADPQKVLDRLRDGGLIQAHSGFGGNRRGYGLTTKGAALCGLHKRTATALGSQSTPECLSVLAFCFLMETPRALLTREDLKELFQTPPVGRFHCVDAAASGPSVYHVYVPGPSTQPGDVVGKTRAHIARSRESAEMAQWLDERLYRYAILVDSPSRAPVMNEAFDQAKDEEGGPLRNAAEILVVHVAGPDGLEEVLRVL
jgi:hypothetical protein